MTINSKRKGKNGENELAAILREYGYAARRGVQYQGGADSPDVVGLPGVHIEVKRQERLNIHDAMEQARRDCGGNIPAVFHRKNRTAWLVTLNIDDFMKIYEGGGNNDRA